MITVTTPALLFPAISLLFLAYTNRFLVLAQLIRQLGQRSDSKYTLKQVELLRERIRYIKLMQGFAVCSFLLCTGSMFFLFLEYTKYGAVSFGLSLIALAISLIYALIEVVQSTNAIELELKEISAKR